MAETASSPITECSTRGTLEPRIINITSLTEGLPWMMSMYPFDVQQIVFLLIDSRTICMSKFFLVSETLDTANISSLSSPWSDILSGASPLSLYGSTSRIRQYTSTGSSLVGYDASAEGSRLLMRCQTSSSSQPWAILSSPQSTCHPYTQGSRRSILSQTTACNSSVRGSLHS